MFSPVIKQVYTTVSVICLFYVHGFCLSVISIMLPTLRRPDSLIHLTSSQESWIASMPFLMGFPVQCITAFLSDRCGRKYIICLSFLPIIVANITMYLATDAYYLITASLFIGLVGGGTGIAPIMVAEIASPKYRGALLSIKPIFFVLGMSSPHFLAQHYDWRNFVLFNIIPSVIGFVTGITSPESPAWLAGQGKFAESKKAFYWLRGEDDSPEMNKLVNTQKISIEKKNNGRKGNSLSSVVKFWSHKGFLKAVAISLAFVVLGEAGGKMVFGMYMIDFLGTITGDKENVYKYAQGADVLNLICLFSSCYLLGKFRKRSLLFVTGVLAVFALFSFCVLSFVTSEAAPRSASSWTRLVLILFFFAMRDTGVLPTAFAALGEIYPLSHRSLGVAVIGFMHSVFVFTYAKMYPNLVLTFKLHGALVGNAMLMTICLIYLYFFLPETQNKTLQDIEIEMKGQCEKDKSLYDLEKQQENLIAVK